MRVWSCPAHLAPVMEAELAMSAASSLPTLAAAPILPVKPPLPATRVRLATVAARYSWNYKLGGYQVLKKWLSYRESRVLKRNLLPDEVAHFSHTARRIAAILMLTTRRTRGTKWENS